MVALSPGATVRSAAPPPWPATAWKSMLWGWVFPGRLVSVIWATSPTRPRRIGPGVPQVTSVSPATRKPHISVLMPLAGSRSQTPSMDSRRTAQIAGSVRAMVGETAGAYARWDSFGGAFARRSTGTMSGRIESPGAYATPAPAGEAPSAPAEPAGASSLHASAIVVSNAMAITARRKVPRGYVMVSCLSD